MLIFMLRFPCLCVCVQMEWQIVAFEAAARENGMPENRLSVCEIVKMHDNKSNKNLFCCVCLNFHPISFSIHVIGMGDRTFARTHACPFVVFSMFSRSLSCFRPLFISLLKYNGNTFTECFHSIWFCVYISTFFWPPKKRISQSLAYSYTIHAFNTF